MGYVVIALCFGLAGGIVGKIKGSSFLLWFLISAVVPIFGLIAAIAYRFERDEPTRPCPRCGSERKLHDAICTRCGQELYFDGRADELRRATADGHADPVDGDADPVDDRAAQV